MTHDWTDQNMSAADFAREAWEAAHPEQEQPMGDDAPSRQVLAHCIDPTGVEVGVFDHPAGGRRLCVAFDLADDCQSLHFSMTPDQARDLILGLQKGIHFAESGRN